MSAQRKQRLMSIFISQDPHYFDVREDNILVKKVVGSQESAKPPAKDVSQGKVNKKPATQFSSACLSYSIVRSNCVVPKAAEGQHLRHLPRGAISARVHLTSK